MDLYLLRHAHALPRDTPGCPADSLRPLTEKGRRQIRHLFRAVKALDLHFDLVLTSPWLRTQQTAADLLLRSGHHIEPIVVPALAANRPPARLLSIIQTWKPAPASLLLVGHEPFLSNLASLILTSSAGLKLDFPKASLCKLEIPSWKTRTRTKLEWLLTQPHMKCFH